MDKPKRLESLTKPAQRAGRVEPRASAAGRCPGSTGQISWRGLKGRERSALAALQAAWFVVPFSPGQRPPAAALGSTLPARWAGWTDDSQHPSDSGDDAGSSGNLSSASGSPSACPSRSGDPALSPPESAVKSPGTVQNSVPPVGALRPGIFWEFIMPIVRTVSFLALFTLAAASLGAQVVTHQGVPSESPYQEFRSPMVLELPLKDFR